MSRGRDLPAKGEIEVLYTRFKHVELANKKIRECNNKNTHDFANYRTVRKIVQGIIWTTDVQMVSDKTITKSVEGSALVRPGLLAHLCVNQRYGVAQ